jgi:hypothetical protein
VSDSLDKREWFRRQPSYGPDWDAAIEFGVDVALLEDNLSLTVQQRFEQHLAQLRLDEALRAAREGLRGTAD